MTVRDRIFVLLASALLVGAASSVAAVLGLVDLGQALRSSAVDLPATRLLAEVATARMAEAASLRHALRFSTSPQAPEARTRFEESANTVAVTLDRALALCVERAGGDGTSLDPSPAEFAASYANYRELAARTLEELASGTDIERSEAALELERSANGFDQKLGHLLVQVSEGGEQGAEEALAAQQRTMMVVAGLSGLAILLGVAVIGRAMHLVAGIRSLSGLLPICSACKKIRDDQGYWKQLESYLHEHSDAELTHGLCGECVEDMKTSIRASRSEGDSPGLTRGLGV